MIDFFMVDVKDIQVNTTDHNFPPAIIENLANAILVSGGLIKPLILKQVGLQSYQLLDGHLEYYAALQAKVKDPRKGEMVNAFVITPDQEDLVKQQVTVLQSVYSLTNPIENATNTPANTSPQSEQSQDLPSNNNLSVTDYTYFQSQLDAKLDAKFSNYQQAIQSQLRQNQQDLQIALQKMQSAWEATLNHQLRQQQEAIQAQLRSHSPSIPPVATSTKISDPPSEVREKTPVTKNGLSLEKVNIKVNINEVKTIQDFKKLKKQYNIPDLGDARIKAIIDFRQKLDGRITSLDQLVEAGSGISQGMINKWSRYFTC
jgi:DNA uptake protein ComE-like DNA-binding protein